MSQTVVPGEHDRARVLWRLLRIAWAYRTRCMLALAAQGAALATTVLALALSGAALDVLHAASTTAPVHVHWPLGLRPPTSWSTWQQVGAAALAVITLALLRVLFSYAHAVWVADLVQGRIVPALRAEVYGKLQQLSLGYFDRNHSGTLLNRITSDVQYLRSFVDGVLIQSVVMLLSAAVYGSYMLGKHLGLALASLATLPLMWRATLRFSRRIQPAYAESRDRLDAFVLAAAETITGISVVKGFAIERDVQAGLDTKNHALRDSQQAIFGRASLYTATMDLLLHTSSLVLLIYGGALVASDQLSVGDLVVFAGLLQQFSQQVVNMATIVNTLQESLVGAQRVFEVLDADPEVANPKRPRAPGRAIGRIRFEGATFGYEAERLALCDLELTIEPGECVAVCGAAGSGKTSLLGLVPRFFDASRGRVLVHGLDVREQDLTALRRSIALVFQESFLFSHTVAQNLTFGQPGATQAQLEAAARAARAHDFIAALPEGYDTLLGEFAVNLSGGQRQRLAIARALLCDPQILLLDDPVAALDAETMREVVASLRSAARGRTTLMVTHCTPLLQQADRIVVLDGGRIVQQGSHASLSAVRGPYSQSLGLHLHSEPPPRSELRDQSA